MVNARNFSPSSIDALAQGRHFDPLVTGLCVVVSHTGRKVWQVRRRTSRSAGTVELRLGTFPAHSIAAARRWGAKLNEAIERGVDPREEIRREKANAMLADAHVICMTAMRRGDRKTLKPRTIEDKEKIFTRDIEPRLGKTTLGEGPFMPCSTSARPSVPPPPKGRAAPPPPRRRALPRRLGSGDRAGACARRAARSAR